MTEDVLTAEGRLTDRYVGTAYPGIGVGVLLLGEGRFPELGDHPDGGVRLLTGVRGPDARNERGLRDIPGGGLEWGEDLAEVAIRELGEETGVVAAAVRELFTFPHHPDGQHWINHVFAAWAEPQSPPPVVPRAERRKYGDLRYHTLPELRARTEELTESMRLLLPRLTEEILAPAS